MSALVSIIIPIYNLELYIGNCLEKIKCQTYKNLEIICVDDGSSDNSAQIVKEFASKDSRFIYIYQENAGVSAARNKGLEVSTGEYIMFVDGDDYLHCQAVEILLKEIIEGSYDMLSSNFDLVDSLDCGTDLVPGYKVTCIDVKDFFNKQTTTSIASTCGKIYARNTVAPFCFPENVTNGEDTVFLFKVLSCDPKIAYVDYPLYYYYRRLGSASRSEFKISLISMIEGFSDLCEYLNNKNSEYILSKALEMLFKMIFSIRTLSVGTENEKYVFDKCKVLGKKNVQILLKNKYLNIKDKSLFLVFLYFRRIYELARLVQDPTMKEFYKNRKKKRKG